MRYFRIFCSYHLYFVFYHWFIYFYHINYIKCFCIFVQFTDTKFKSNFSRENGFSLLQLYSIRLLRLSPNATEHNAVPLTGRNRIRLIWMHFALDFSMSFSIPHLLACSVPHTDIFTPVAMYNYLYFKINC